MTTIGVSGKKWGDDERQKWFNEQTIKRSYQDEVISQITLLKPYFTVHQYGALPLDEQKYPLFALKSNNWQKDKKTVLVTGGVHGYETSGVQGALRFLHNEAGINGTCYSELFNIIVVPCVSPWGYETINRWNNKAIDPNRSFYANSPAEESSSLMAFVAGLDTDINVHIDLHETTDTDNSVFRPALSARDAIEQKSWDIPDGFYLVGNSLNPQVKFQQAIIKAVNAVTHIALADENSKLIGEVLEQFGVINYAGKELGLCMGLTDATYVTTTEVYPDSPKVDDENCILAQVTAITGALDFIINERLTG
ncbi:MAG: hypothetical protein ACI87J_002231 [Colwellia sp.]|jgi:hypothetical protein